MVNNEYGAATTIIINHDQNDNNYTSEVDRLL